MDLALVSYYVTIVLEYIDVSKKDVVQPTESHFALWRQVVAILLANRTIADHNILLAFGEQLHGFGRTIPSHVW